MMKYVAFIIFSAFFIGCAWEAQGDIQQNTAISPTTNFQLDTNSTGQAVGSKVTGDNPSNNKE